MLHRIVWTAFRGPILPGLVIDHHNRNREDNRLENLEAVTQSENACRGHAPLRPGDFVIGQHEGGPNERWRAIPSYLRHLFFSQVSRIICDRPVFVVVPLAVFRIHRLFGVSRRKKIRKNGEEIS